MNDEILKARIFGTVALQSATIEFKGRKYVPDETKAYATFKAAHAFPVVTAYGTNIHPGTLANSFASMDGAMVDYDHQMKCYDRSKNKDEIRSDQIIGTVLAVDFPPAPLGGWKVGLDKGRTPAIDGVMVLHKRAVKAQSVLAEHLTGKHKWSVSIEMGFSVLNSGFVVGGLEGATDPQKQLMAEATPPELTGIGMGYVAVQDAPEALLKCFDLDKRRIVSTWGKCPVSFMQGGINGENHFAGLGIVRYGAEREAEIGELLARDPDRLETGEDGLLRVDDGLLRDHFKNSTEGFASLTQAFRNVLSRALQK